MCEICRKSYCPSVCPNYYTPRKRRRSGDGGGRSIKFSVTRRVELGEPLLVWKGRDGEDFCGNEKGIKRKREIERK